MKVCCVVVTYNRKKLLIECINAILQQTYKVEKLIVIDNNSTDNTSDYLDENNLKEYISYHKLNENVGGAGGFYEGIKIALRDEYDWVWVMDDDSIPSRNALKTLINSLDIINDNNIGFLCSKVIGPNNEEMNIPNLSKRIEDNGYPSWMKYLDKGIVEVESATFVSVLINFKAIKNIGLPCKQFFLWGDDIEYTLRLNRFFGNGYVIGNSIVTHKRLGAKNLSIIEENNLSRLNMYKYMYRNNIFLFEYLDTKARILRIINQIIYAFKVLIKSKKYRLKKFIIIIQSTFNGILNFRLRKQFRNRMKIN